jgi:predicted O-methyltransferase YrrM
MLMLSRPATSAHPSSKIEATLRSVGAAFPPSQKINRAEAISCPPELQRLVADLYEEFGDDLLQLARELVGQRARLDRAGFTGAFGDGEGELLYLLLRATKPTAVFEISPATGWSTNYILAALTDNGVGDLHSFEITETAGGRPIEEVIRGNLLPNLDQHRLSIHVGDATTTVGDVQGPVDFVVLDSCHDAFFADWYLHQLLPRVHGVAFVQDIHFWDRPEESGEARIVIDWALRHQLALASVGMLERAGVGRPALPPRWPNESNAVFFWVDGPQIATSRAPLWEFEAEPTEAAALSAREGAVGDAARLAELALASRSCVSAEMTNEMLEEAIAARGQTVVSLLHVASMSLDSPARLGLVAEQLEARADARTSVGAASFLADVGRSESAKEIALQASAARRQSLPVTVRAAEVLARVGDIDRAADLARANLDFDDPRVRPAHRFLWRAAAVLDACEDPASATSARRHALVWVKTLPNNQKAWREFLPKAVLHTIRRRDALFLVEVLRTALNQRTGRRAVLDTLRRAVRRAFSRGSTA